VKNLLRSGKPEDLLLYSEGVTTWPFVSQVSPVHTVLKLLTLVFYFKACSLHL